MTDFGPHRDDGWRSGGAVAARIEILRRRKIASWEHAYSLWLTASVCQGMGGFVNLQVAQNVNDALWEACNAESIYQGALQGNY